MAVKAKKAQSTMVIKYKTGVGKNGDDILKSQRFSKIKAASLDGDIFAVSNSIGSILVYPVMEVLREDLNLLINEG